jgi:hypothetical protein
MHAGLWFWNQDCRERRYGNTIILTECSEIINYPSPKPQSSCPGSCPDN